MPKYIFKNKESGVMMEKSLRISELDTWKSENPEWIQQITAPTILYGSRRDNLSRAGDGWNDLLGKVKSGSGRNNTIKTK